MQSNNCLEFKNKLMVSTICKWECKLVYGSRFTDLWTPPPPITRTSGTMEIMIGAYMEQYKTIKWTELLPLIMYNLNTSSKDLEPYYGIVDVNLDLFVNSLNICKLLI